MAELTKARVRALLDQAPKQLPDGRVLCQVCGREFGKRSALGPHQLGHRREVGLMPQRTARSLPNLRVLSCPDCGVKVQKRGLRAHLQNVHDLSHEAAAFRTQEVVLAAVTEAAAPPPVIHTNGPEPERSPVTDLSGTEAVTGILAAARTDGLIPTRLLPAVTDLIRHTDAVLEELARLSRHA